MPAATSAAHAGAADEATHAKDAGTVGGLDAKSFMPAGVVVAGSAQTYATTVQTFLESPLGFRLETDGLAGFDATVTLRNTRSTNLVVLGDPGGVTVAPGSTHVVKAGLSPLNGAGDHEIQFLVQDPTTPKTEAYVDCFLPAAGTGASRSFCMSVYAP